MNFEKIKEILNNKRVQAIAGSVAGVLIVTLAGTMILHNKNIENKTVAVEKNTTTDNKAKDKKESDNKVKEETAKDDREQLEELKNTDTSNLSDEEKKDLENKIADMENKIANEAVTEENNEVVSNTSNSTSNSSSSSSSGSSSSTTSSNSSTSNTSQSSVSSSNSKPSSGSSSSSSSSSSNNGSSSNEEETHNWMPITTIVHHDEVGHWEDVVVTPAWTEEVPVYEEQEVLICNDCGEILNSSNANDHAINHLLNGGKGSWRTEWRQVQVGTNAVTHPAVTEKKWVVDKAAWDETVITGYRCTIHGETK